MFRTPRLIPILFFLCALGCSFSYSQTYVFNLSLKDNGCEKSAVSLTIKGMGTKDSLVYIHWSTGESNVDMIEDLTQGDHSVNIRIKHKDSVSVNRDTTLNFTINQQPCKVSLGKYFSPNDDQYNDVFGIGNWQYYPNFELQIFNKWGQKVHAQAGTYVPWDGKWNGISLPDGTYYYVFFYDAAKRNKFEKGDVTILR